MVEVVNSKKNLERVEREGINYDIHEEFKDIDNAVESVLDNNLIARNNDIWLMFLVWKLQNTAELTYINNEKGFFIPTKNIGELLTPSGIFRARRKLNSEGFYLPTDESILNKRGLREKEIRDKFAEEKNGRNAQY